MRIFLCILFFLTGIIFPSAGNLYASASQPGTYISMSQRNTENSREKHKSIAGALPAATELFCISKKSGEESCSPNRYFSILAGGRQSGCEVRHRIVYAGSESRFLPAGKLHIFIKVLRC
jgi:hypothetical protein